MQNTLHKVCIIISCNRECVHPHQNVLACTNLSQNSITINYQTFSTTIANVITYFLNAVLCLKKDELNSHDVGY